MDLRFSSIAWAGSTLHSEQYNILFKVEVKAEEMFFRNVIDSSGVITMRSG